MNTDASYRTRRHRVRGAVNGFVGHQEWFFPEAEFREKWCDHDPEYKKRSLSKDAIKNQFLCKQTQRSSRVLSTLLQCLFTKKRLSRKTAFLYSALWSHHFAKYISKLLREQTHRRPELPPSWINFKERICPSPGNLCTPIAAVYIASHSLQNGCLQPKSTNWWYTKIICPSGLWILSHFLHHFLRLYLCHSLSLSLSLYIYIYIYIYIMYI